jgi:hypothetical protein
MEITVRKKVPAGLFSHWENILNSYFQWNLEEPHV